MAALFAARGLIFGAFYTQDGDQLASVAQEALIDPACCESLPAMVVASPGFDLLCHALECYTAKAYTRWAKVDDPARRPLIQGANPWSDLAARKALEIVGEFLDRGVNDAADTEARDQLRRAAQREGRVLPEPGGDGQAGYTGNC